MLDYKDIMKSHLFLYVQNVHENDNTMVNNAQKFLIGIYQH